MLKKTKQYRIGIMPGGIDGLFLTKRHLDKNIQIYFLVPNGRPEQNWAKSFLPAQKLIGYNLKNKKISMAVIDFDGLAKNSDLAKQLLDNKINYLFVHHGVTPYLDAWAKKHKIKLIATPAALREKLENKIYFDNFLKKHKLPKPKSQIYLPQKSKIKLAGRLVLQETDSSGGDGTFFVNGQTDIDKLVAKHKIKSSQKYLLRQFKEGLTYGITVFVSSDLIALSALRVQCYSGQNNLYQSIFAGIQWLPSRSFDKNLVKKINHTFIDLGRILRRQNFTGYANIDFIADKQNKIYILECNPRLAASTTQLLQFPETISSLLTDKIYLEESLDVVPKNKKLKLSYFPKSDFAGSLLYISTPPDQKKFLIKKNYAGGVYQLSKNNLIIFKTPDITKITKNNKQFIFYPDAAKNEKHTPGTIIASIISDFPLYDKTGIVNQSGKIIFKYFKY